MVNALLEMGFKANYFWQWNVVSKAIAGQSKHFKPESRSSEESALCTPAVKFAKSIIRKYQSITMKNDATIRAALDAARLVRSAAAASHTFKMVMWKIEVILLSNRLLCLGITIY